MRYNVLQILPPFLSVKFDWSIAEAAHLLSIVPGVSLIIYLALPSLMKILLNSLNMPVPVTNLYIVRISLILLCVGVAVMALTTTIPGVITALVVFSGGFNIRAPMLAVMSEYIDPTRETARLFMLISITDALGHVVWSPILESIWGLAVGQRGTLLSLPFFILTGWFFIATIITAFLTLRKAITVEDRGGRAENEPLLANHVE
ncbi:hypothetical protein V8E54_006361 [Elaphomyces granulatus]